MIPASSYAHSISVVPSALRHPTGTHDNYDSGWVVAGWGFLIIVLLILLGSQKLVPVWHRKYQLHRSVVLLQRRAALEHLLTRKVAFKPAPKQRKFQ